MQAGCNIPPRPDGAGSCRGSRSRPGLAGTWFRIVSSYRHKFIAVDFHASARACRSPRWVWGQGTRSLAPWPWLLALGWSSCSRSPAPLLSPAPAPSPWPELVSCARQCPTLPAQPCKERARGCQANAKGTSQTICSHKIMFGIAARLQAV